MRRDPRPDGPSSGGRTLRAAADGGRPARGDRVLVLNPISGSADHAATVRDLAADHGFSVRETDEERDGVRLAAEAVEDGAEFVAACGGDGTINEVVRGVDRAGGLGDVTLGVVPAGTGNNFAGNVGVEGIEHAFEVMESGRRRRIDVGRVSATTDEGTTERPFVNSCVGGLTAEASGATEAESKSRFGVVAYVLTTLRTLADFDAVRLGVDLESASVPREGGAPRDDGESESGYDDARGGWEGEAWHGEALCVLVGNGRRFPAEGRTQADMEDGLFDVTIIEDRPAVDLAGQAAVQRLFGGETEHITRLKAPELSLDVLGDEPIRFSLDGEMIAADRLAAETRAGGLDVCVGESYEPHPE
ncbi:diacylglycerol/lipid kinase family protein [Halegenticoccus soli]|uniref:diacylglycerol/lipid kinase family protein n=1 Tax=Halegenticoccus soli TaxID=1985678 RepID=UPI000C6D5B27|nr:diacylglycerol kinase family protein [Halegenticoccus soli]